MSEWLANALRTREPERPAWDSEPSAHDPSDEIVRYFQTCLPVMLDGALQRGDDRGLLLRQARLSLHRGRVNPNHLPVAILRETLESIAAAPNPKTMAGVAPVGPRHARVWWDERVTDSLDDVLSHLDDPRLVLRFYDVTGVDPDAGRWHETFDVDVELREAGKTVQFWSSDRTYVVDLGYVHADGRFLRLARTGTVDLPRDGKGEPGAGETALSNLRHAGDKKAPYVKPDAAAKEWAALRPDCEARDWDAELVVHMLYRAFLLEGPRALRRVPALVRRDADVLRREFFQRRRRAVSKPARFAPAFLVSRLDAPSAVGVGPIVTNQPVVAARFGLALGALFPTLSGDGFAWHRALLHAARVNAAASVAELLRPEPEPKVDERVAAAAFEPEEARPETPAAGLRPHIRVAGADIPVSLFATPVFEAAKHLRESLAGFRPFDPTVVPEAPVRLRQPEPAPEAAPIFGATEAKRLAKAGVRVSRMSLTLEGRMRPGARLKVAGKLVHADAGGNFRVECVLTGRRTSIPMRAGTSISGEARSLISIDWTKRPNHKLVTEA